MTPKWLPSLLPIFLGASAILALVVAAGVTLKPIFFHSITKPVVISNDLPVAAHDPSEMRGFSVENPMVTEHKKDVATIQALQGQMTELKGELADVSDKAQMWQSILTQQDTLLDVFNTALPDLPVYRQNVYVVVSLPEATFDFSSSKLSAASERKLALIARIFNRYEGVFYLGIEGHTDNVPMRNKAKYNSNLALGAARAQMAYQTMLKAGIPDDKMAVISWGASMPLVRHPGIQADPANRRIELVFAPKRAIEHPEPVASLLTPDVRERLRAYAVAFLKPKANNAEVTIRPPYPSSPEKLPVNAMAKSDKKPGDEASTADAR